ncbi:hypothetical protein F5B22DRAFT_454294 [Xylaria bambusicola]|uniref:uncharacterized protein n=1 Tax=Xylaria bambusicola TaxID=326684 RepID=UPI002007B9CC|nr:uncharacterized protein F5B22DRAFT_454294 [Xylaria bambusicola]KAI0506264.1 hypothetical protein F5B22DRAFT_454294 [Xylaria bambusicola]
MYCRAMAYGTAPPVSPPFQRSDQLNRESSSDLAIRHGIRDVPTEWDDRINSDLKATILDEIYPSLWLVGQRSPVHVDPLHKQVLKNRAITIAEDPKLHLVWYYNTVYIKPLPVYLLNHAIWEAHLPEPVGEAPEHRSRYDKYRAALGFLRSYGLLIRHESDFIIAQRANLLPKYVSFQRFQIFIQPFRSCSDDQVSLRYQYGQLRLTRLNWAVRIIKFYRIISRKQTQERLPWNYQEQLWQTSQHIQKYATPLIFVFAVLSLILSSMQVAFAAREATTWDAFVRVSWGFSIAILVFAATLGVLVIAPVLLVVIVHYRSAVRRRTQ